MRSVLGLSAILILSTSAFSQEPLAIVGATIVDGRGGAPLENGTVLIEDGRISALGPGTSVEVPSEARTVDGRGRFVLPGFIDTNVHLSLYGGHTPERYETLVRYHDRQEEVVLEASQLHLKGGVTTVRDSYGVLPPLLSVRDAIAQGEDVGSRMLVAGNIVGWGGPFSLSFSLIQERGLTLFQEQMNDLVAQGVGEDLMDMTPAELAVAIDAYLDKGVDFIKFGGTGHFSMPTFIGFSLEAQEVMVERAHARGKIAETHSTNIEGLRLSLEAGVDLVQHPEVLDPRPMPEALAALFVEKDVICSMLVNTMTGPAWQKHLEDRENVQSEDARTGHQGAAKMRPRTSAELRRQDRALGELLEIRRRNAIQLIEAGCRVTVGTDNYRSAAPEFARGPKPDWQDPGSGTIYAIEGLVELGMTPSEAIVSATRHGAAAAGMLDELGTLEVGKLADVLVLDANPLADISNIRKLRHVIKDGKLVDVDALPTRPVYYRP